MSPKPIPALFSKDGKFEDRYGNSSGRKPEISDRCWSAKRGWTDLDRPFDHLVRFESVFFKWGTELLATGLLAYTNGVGQLGTGLHQMTGESSPPSYRELDNFMMVYYL